MTESLWQHSAEELLARTASAAPTPGGGAVAALCAAFGIGLLEMAMAVTLDGGSGSGSGSGTSGAGSVGDPTGGDPTGLAAARDAARELRSGVSSAVDADVADFDTLMAAYRLPRESEAEQAARTAAIATATVTATRGPLELAEAAVAAVALADRIEPLVKATIVSDVQAGRDLLRGAARAALATADINVAALERSVHPEAATLAARRDAVRRSATGTDAP